jgi:GNAT superfamily N-acetyltransferase
MEVQVLLATNTFYRNISHIELLNPSYQQQLISFLFDSLQEYRDPETDIRACLEYIIHPDKGGHIFVAENEKKEILGVVFLANTHMGQFVPEYLLVYIATSPHYRGQGIGYQLIEKIQQFLNAPIALHVEYDNPAVKLYDKLGFTSKYKEMRWYPRG